MPLTGAPETVDSVLDVYRQFMRALQAQRQRRGVDPWHGCQVTVPQLRALSLIASSQHGLSSRELADRLGVGASAVTPLVDRLVERGYVLRHEDARDRRIGRLHVTETGRVFLEGLQASQAELMHDLLIQLDPTQLHTVGQALQVLRSTLERIAD